MRKRSRQDVYLDALISLALMELDAEETERFVRSPDPALSVLEIQGADRAFQAVMGQISAASVGAGICVGALPTAGGDRN